MTDDRTPDRGDESNREFDAATEGDGASRDTGVSRGDSTTRDDNAPRDGECSRKDLDSSDDPTGYDEYAYRDANGMKRWTHCPKCHRKVMVVALVEPSAAQVAPCGCRLPPDVLKK